MKTLFPLIASFFLVGTAAAQQAQPSNRGALDGLSGSGQAGAVYDGSEFDGTPVLVQASTPPAPGMQAPALEDDVVVTPVVSVKPREQNLVQWAEKEGGERGSLYGAAAGGGAGLILALILGLTGVIGLGPAFLIVLGGLMLGALGGSLLGRHLGRKRAEELSGPSKN